MCFAIIEIYNIDFDLKGLKSNNFQKFRESSMYKLTKYESYEIGFIRKQLDSTFD